MLPDKLRKMIIEKEIDLPLRIEKDAVENVLSNVAGVFSEGLKAIFEAFKESQVERREKMMKNFEEKFKNTDAIDISVKEMKEMLDEHECDNCKDENHSNLH